MYQDRNIQNLALTGFMGVGKSTVGRYLSGILKFRFVDTDEMIESRQRTSIPDLFSNHGELFFRELERELVVEMQEWRHCVISTGGGMVAFGNNMELLKRSSFVVCLWASPETIYQRIKRQSHRPLLKTHDPLATIRELLAARRAAYQSADLIVNTETRPMRQISQIIMRQFRQVHQA